MKILLACLFLFLSYLPASACFFVSPAGSNANAGTSSGAPFQTLEKAQAAMLGSGGGTLCTNVMQGTYNRNAPLILTSADAGETWQANAGDPALSAILDGGCTTDEIFLIFGGSNITINGLKMQNVVRGGVRIHGGKGFDPSNTLDDPYFATLTGAATGNTVENSEVYYIIAPTSYVAGVFQLGVFLTGGVVAEGDVSNTSVLNNYIHETGWAAIGLLANSGTTTDSISNSTVQGNVILRTCLSKDDCGAIYLTDGGYGINGTGNGLSTSILINHNYISNYNASPSLGSSHAVYLDSATSNATITNNVLRAAWGSLGTSTFINNFGGGNSISNNIIDQGRTGIIQLNYWTNGAASSGYPGGNGNTFEKNIIVQNYAGNELPNKFGDSSPYICTGAPSFTTPPVITNNLYFNYAGGQALSTNTLVLGCTSDSAPVTATDPKIVNGYQLCTGSGVPNASCTGASPALGSPLSFTQLAGSWGPPGFSIPAGY